MTDQEMLQAMAEMLKPIQSDISGLRDEMNERFESIDEQLADIREDVDITRVAANTLVDWAERVEDRLDIPLLKKAE